MKIVKKAIYPSLLATLLLPVAANALSIDEFDTAQAQIAVAPLGPNSAASSAQTAGTDIIGGERDMILSIGAGLSPFQSTAAVDFGRFLLANDSESMSTMTFQWDGDNDATSATGSALDTAGLGAIDLTEGNATNAFEVRFLFDDLPATLDMTIHSAAGTSTVSWPNPGLLLTGSLSIYIPFDVFIGDADFTSVGAIEMAITSPVNGLDVSIDYVRTVLQPVPVPPAVILFGSSLIGLAITRRRRA